MHFSERILVVKRRMTVFQLLVLGLISVVFCASELLTQFSAVFCLVRSVLWCGDEYSLVQFVVT